jgi:hypothetical protein
MLERVNFSDKIPKFCSYTTVAYGGSIPM